jgi:hypothetical protein
MRGYWGAIGSVFFKRVQLEVDMLELDYTLRILHDLLQFFFFVCFCFSIATGSLFILNVFVLL